MSDTSARDMPRLLFFLFFFSKHYFAGNLPGLGRQGLTYFDSLHMAWFACLKRISVEVRNSESETK